MQRVMRLPFHAKTILDSGPSFAGMRPIVSARWPYNANPSIVRDDVPGGFQPRQQATLRKATPPRLFVLIDTSMPTLSIGRTRDLHLVVCPRRDKPNTDPARNQAANPQPAAAGDRPRDFTLVMLHARPPPPPPSSTRPACGRHARAGMHPFWAPQACRGDPLARPREATIAFRRTVSGIAGLVIIKPQHTSAAIRR